MKRFNLIILLLISVIAFGCSQVVKQNPLDSGPNISYITPTSGDKDTVITIAGSGFGDERGTSNIYYGNQKLTPESWSNNIITVRLYDNTLNNNPTGQFKVEVEGNFSNLSPQVFTSSSLTGISSISPSEGVANTLIYITLNNPPATPPTVATFFELSNPSNQAQAILNRIESNRFFCNVPNLSNIKANTAIGVQIGHYTQDGNTMYFQYISPTGSLSQTEGCVLQLKFP